MPKNRPRILFVSYTANWTGPTNSLTLLLKYLRERYDVAVLAPKSGLFSERMASENIPFFSMDNLKREAIFDIRRLIKQEGFDLVYANNTSGTSRNALIAAKLAGRPVICHVREMGWGKSWRVIGYLRFADAVIAVSQACATSVERFVSREKLNVVYNGILFPESPTNQTESREKLLSETGLAATDVIITKVAHVVERKGQEYAVEAMSQVVKAVPNARLLIMGGLDREEHYVRKIKEMIVAKDLTSHVRILGFRPDVQQLVAGADMFMHTANKDPHPRAVLEAMSSGLTGVAFATDGVVETVLDNETGLLVPVNDAAKLAEGMIKLATDPILRKTMGDAGRMHVEKSFSAEVTANNVAQVIDKVLK